MTRFAFVSLLSFAVILDPVSAAELSVKETEMFTLPEGAKLDTLVVSPDGKAWHCEASIRKEPAFEWATHVVRNGKIGPGFEDIWIASENDAAHLLYRGTLADESQVLFHEQTKIAGPAGTISEAAISHDGKRLAHQVYIRERKQAVLTLDGKEVPDVNGVEQFVFSPDGKRAAYSINAGGKSWVVVDGVKQKEYQRTSWITFSADSQHVVYPATIDTDQYVPVVDGKEAGEPYRRVYSPRLSVDGKRLAFIAVVGKDENCAVIDGVQGKTYKRLNLHDSPMFSPDGKHYAYPAVVAPNRAAMVHDGKEGKDYANAAGAFFSPDGKRLAYWAMPDPKTMLLVVDGVEAAEAHTGGSALTFSPDSRNVVCVAKQGDGFCIIRDGVSSRPYPMIVREVHFTSDKRFHVFAVKDQKVVKVEVGE